MSGVIQGSDNPILRVSGGNPHANILWYKYFLVPQQLCDLPITSIGTKKSGHTPQQASPTKYIELRMAPAWAALRYRNTRVAHNPWTTTYDFGGADTKQNPKRHYTFRKKERPACWYG